MSGEILVYHGSTCEIRQPDVRHSKRYLDFGVGFYVTTIPEQAEKWALRRVYVELLEERIIDRLAQVKGVSRRAAMDAYYRSRLSDEIHDGTYGIDNMDYRYLVDDLIENEPELFNEDARGKEGQA